MAAPDNKYVIKNRIEIRCVVSMHTFTQENFETFEIVKQKITLV